MPTVVRIYREKGEGNSKRVSETERGRDRVQKKHPGYTMLRTGVSTSCRCTWYSHTAVHAGNRLGRI